MDDFEKESVLLVIRQDLTGLVLGLGAQAGSNRMFKEMQSKTDEEQVN